MGGWVRFRALGRLLARNEIKMMKRKEYGDVLCFVAADGNHEAADTAFH